ncbi:unnamed protein product [Fraxinus pennsylvanica]|uniref:Uncharacterized protein n=1 Tax=Fraxinus pennsylvanica TaxID=56036 RepID=A0AAD2E545_9LAMI|nr:unnamed protein product [Fraxinus pennsylvanica]
MDNDVCSLALENRTIFTVLLFHKQWTFEERVKSSYAYRHLNKSVLERAPCSVRILIDYGSFKSFHQTVPFHKQFTIDGRVSVNSFNQNGDQKAFDLRGHSMFRITKLFLAGADDCEALSYTSRLVENPQIELTFSLWLRQWDHMKYEDETGKTVYTQLVNQFRANTVGNQRVILKQNGSSMVH